MDIGCGAGTFLGQLKNSKSYGLDIAKKQILYAKKHYKNNRTKFILMKKNRIPLKSKSVDSITILDLIEHLKNNEIKLLLKESHRVLKKNGKILITTPNYISMWPILEFIVNSVSDLSYEDQHINKFNIFRIKKIFDKKKFKISSLKISIGPYARKCCYEVGVEFLETFNNSINKVNDKYYLDLTKNIKQFAYENNINLEDTNVCTIFNKEYFSYRKNKTNESQFSFIWI